MQLQQLSEQAIAPSVPAIPTDLQLTVTRKVSETELHQGVPYYVVESGTTFIAMVSTWSSLWWVTFRDGQGITKYPNLETAIAAVFAQAEQVVASAELERHVEAIATEIAPDVEGVDVALYTLGYQTALVRGSYNTDPSFRKGFGDGMHASRQPLPVSPEPLAVLGWGGELLNAGF